jgi:hypothetical protein
VLDALRISSLPVARSKSYKRRAESCQLIRFSLIVAGIESTSLWSRSTTSCQLVPLAGLVQFNFKMAACAGVTNRPSAAAAINAGWVCRNLGHLPASPRDHENISNIINHLGMMLATPTD